MKIDKKVVIILSAIIIIIGAIICKYKGFNIELLYLTRQEIILSDNISLDENKINEIAKSILTERKVKVQKIERFSNSIKIISTAISEEEKETIINKINEECQTNISNEDIDIINISNTKISDILKLYFIPAIISFLIIIVYFAIIYNKIGIKSVLIKSILIPIVVELLYYSIIAITRIEFGRITNAFAVGVYLVSILALTLYFQKKKENYVNTLKKENDD